MLQAMSITDISRRSFRGPVYNVELEGYESGLRDDLFWVEQSTGIVTHNCFPKDLNALIYVAKRLGVEPTCLAAAWRKNLEVRPERDWEKLKGRAVSDRGGVTVKDF